MDARQRLLFEELVRSTVSRDLDQLAGEVTMLRRRLAAVEAVAKVPAAPEERRERAAELRREGCSVRMISTVLRASRATVSSDLEAAGVFPPGGEVVGLDGRRTTPPLRPAG